MTTKKDSPEVLLDALKYIEGELEVAKAEVDAFGKARVEMLALIDGCTKPAVAAPTKEQPKAAKKLGRPPFCAGRFTGKTLRYAVGVVIKEALAPIHVSKIEEAVRRGGFVTKARNRKSRIDAVHVVLHREANLIGATKVSRGVWFRAQA